MTTDNNMKYRKKPVVIEALQWDGSMEGMESIKKHWPEMSKNRCSTAELIRLNPQTVTCGVSRIT